MKGAIKTVKIKGKDFDIKKEGSTLAIECQSIFMTIIRNSGTPLDEDLKNIDMMSAMTRDIVQRIKYVFIECVASPKIDEESFEEIAPSIIPKLFFAVYDYQTAEAEAKKKEPRNSTD